MIKVNAYLHTDGSGWWSEIARKVHITGLKLVSVNEDSTFGELRVYFNVGTWNVDEDGLIYTDRLWLELLRGFLVEMDLPADVEYSEQGMQGRNYVSLDVGAQFIHDFNQKMEIVHE